MGMPQVVQYAGRRTSVEAGKTLRSRLVRLFADRFTVASSRRPRLDLEMLPQWRKRDLGFADGQDWRVGDDLFR
ncbi:MULTISPECIES: hypothetical protein [unclassified Rhizobium]|jgi:hypothetical protein|uniref:hypothetical protein n=1 Tax=unclassified Rhizobium TaxID=2613769 RepID=UPI000DD63EB0|nr:MULTISPECIES: hypothetical protein [unclassified Rhizobium]MBB3442460.1 hypothetical protein [Rhizobium sp. BK379]MBB3561870.1 hypothetical protein [Rhizobium sp. BK512]